MTASSADHPLPRSALRRWLHALKPASWPKLFVPTLLGQALGSVGGFDWSAMGWGFAFTTLGLAFIVLLNDWGDRRVDSLKRSMFPQGGSPKTIPDRILTAQSVGMAGVLCWVGTLLVAAGAEIVLQRRFAWVGGLGCTLIFAAYTLPPLRLNYRGGGELLEMLGVGVALPLYDAYLQAGQIPARTWPWVAGFALLSLASGIASGLSDEQSDRAGGKRTWATRFGNASARRMTEACVLLGAGVWLGSSLWRPGWVPLVASVPALLIIAWNFRHMRRISPSAVTNAFRAQGAYKRYLHRAIWHSTAVASLVLWLRASFS